MEALIAYHNKPSIKTKILKQLKGHFDADQIVKGVYWENGRGCGVGCTVHGSDHSLYEPRFGIPQVLARLEDTIFEGLPNELAKAWPQRFMRAIAPGADLRHVQWAFLHRILTDEAITPGINHPTVKKAVDDVARLLLAWSKGDPIDASAAESAASAARSAAWSAASAAWSAESAASAAWSAESAASAAWSAERSAARSAESAASAAWSAERSAASAAWSAERSAARSAASAASAAWSAERSAARSAAESAAYTLMANVLIELLEAAPMALDTGVVGPNEDDGGGALADARGADAQEGRL